MTTFSEERSSSSWKVHTKPVKTNTYIWEGKLPPENFENMSFWQPKSINLYPVTWKMQLHKEEKTGHIVKTDFPGLQPTWTLFWFCLFDCSVWSGLTFMFLALGPFGQMAMNTNILVLSWDSLLRCWLHHPFWPHFITNLHLLSYQEVIGVFCFVLQGNVNCRISVFPWSTSHLGITCRSLSPQKDRMSQSLKCVKCLRLLRRIMF